MCDFFWLSPADQAGDLSDVVRASLQPPPPPPATPPAPTTVFSLVVGSHHLSEEDRRLPLNGRVNFGGHHEVHEQLVHGNNGGMLAGFLPAAAGSNSNAALLCSQLHPEAEQGLMVLPQPPPMPQLCTSSSFVDRDDDAHHHTTAIKRRKSQTKKVVCIPAPVAAPPVGPGVGGGRASTSGGEVVPSDLWAWRKYGQKPIKGSPYPRGYYRCSSSKGCSARKQVERSRTDPSMLVITYTSDHNHPWPTQRNALAGSTRPASSAAATARAHHHQRQRHSVPPAHHRHADNATPIIGASGGTDGSIHHQLLLLKQEVVDMDNPRQQQQQQDAAAADHDLLGLGMFADMDGAQGASDLHPKNLKQQQHATADQRLEEEKLQVQEEEDKQSLLGLGPDPFSFSFSFLDWVGASFGVGETTAEDNGAGARS